MLKIAFPPGIGDAHWSMMKLRALRKFHNDAPIMAVIGMDQFHGTAEYLKLVPFIYDVKVVKELSNISLMMKPSYKHEKYSTITGSRNWMGYDYVFVANGHFENGGRIEDWMPELVTDYTYPINIPSKVFELVTRKLGSGRVLIYMGGVEPNIGFHGGWWKPEWWVQIINGFNEMGIQPLIIGGPNGSDERYFQMVLRQTGGSKLKFDNIIGMTSHAEICALIMISKLWIGLNSGTGILSASFGTPTLMLWSDSDFPLAGTTQLHRNMKTSWLQKDRLHCYKTLSYGDEKTTPEKVLDIAGELLRK